MKAGKFQYKCRLCGEKYTDAITSEENAKICLLYILRGEKEPPNKMFGSLPEMVEAHAGCKAGYGVADLQGVIFVEE